MKNRRMLILIVTVLQGFQVHGPSAEATPIAVLNDLKRNIFAQAKFSRVKLFLRLNIFLDYLETNLNVPIAAVRKRLKNKFSAFCNAMRNENSKIEERATIMRTSLFATKDHYHIEQAATIQELLDTFDYVKKYSTFLVAFLNQKSSLIEMSNYAEYNELKKFQEANFRDIPLELKADAAIRMQLHINELMTSLEYKQYYEDAPADLKKSTDLNKVYAFIKIINGGKFKQALVASVKIQVDLWYFISTQQSQFQQNGLQVPNDLIGDEQRDLIHKRFQDDAIDSTNTEREKDRHMIMVYELLRHNSQFGYAYIWTQSTEYREFLGTLDEDKKEELVNNFSNKLKENSANVKDANYESDALQAVLSQMMAEN